jgi:hypothetical protein
MAKTEKPHHTKNKRTIYPTKQTAALQKRREEKESGQGSSRGRPEGKGRNALLRAFASPLSLRSPPRLDERLSEKILSVIMFENRNYGVGEFIKLSLARTKE